MGGMWRDREGEEGWIVLVIFIVVICFALGARFSKAEEDMPEAESNEIIEEHIPIFDYGIYFIQ